ncbi:MAG TPA: VWA domain-containing protein [Chitinophagaceae bacterium]|nr:VWA domain-containing protein [Chitinophagaceae bacterium]
MVLDYFDNAHFAYPWLLGLFVLLPFFIWWYLARQPASQATLVMPSVANIKTIRSWKNTFRHAPFVLRMLAVSCIILALARPQLRDDEELVNGEGVDIVLCIDVSGSMLAQDFTPNRIEAAKEVASNFVAGRPTDRIGVVIFSGESFTLCPLTTDQAVLHEQIANIQSGLLEDGTAIGSGLATGIDRLRASQSKSKVIILLTDGENNGGQIPPVTAKELAKATGVKVYTIGVGTEGYAQVPMQTVGGTVIMQREKVNIDEKLLTQIANETGGKYFRAHDNESLKSIYGEIDKLEKSRIEVTALKRYSEKFFPLALAAAALLLLEAVLRFTFFKKFP